MNRLFGVKMVLGIALGAALAGCGADGEPLQPTRDATITLSGTGAAASVGMGVRQGPVSVTLGLGL